jgi:hypothetical protein
MWEDYERRLLDANPRLGEPGVIVTVTGRELLRKLRQAFCAGKAAERKAARECFADQGDTDIIGFLKGLCQGPPR